ncbi:MAG: RDD family protein, partial [Rickettsiaceae bacterium]|nr:RDD family protein [Rickettsiaceae bacterium]
GQTIGKYILKMKVVDLSDYQKISFTRSALRYFGYIFGLISIVMLFFSKNRRVLQDYLGHTIVIKT